MDWDAVIENGSIDLTEFLVTFGIGVDSGLES
jgi:hypothetical protein